jgi:hypothetical protein
VNGPTVAAPALEPDPCAPGAPLVVPEVPP